MYDLQEQEGHFTIDYYTGKVIAYSNRPSVCRRILKYTPEDKYTLLELEKDNAGDVMSIRIQLKADDIGLMLQSRIWKTAKRYD